MEPHAEVKQVILYAALPGGSLILAECADGSLRLLRDELPVLGCRWAPDQVTEAAAAFHQMAAKLKPEN
jgi:hypothetical protein